MEHNYTIHDGYLQDPQDENKVIPFENVYFVKAIKGSYCVFVDDSKVPRKISHNIGYVLKAFNNPDFVRYNDNGFANMNVISEVKKKKANTNIRDIVMIDNTILKTSKRKTGSFLRIYKIFRATKQINPNVQGNE